MKGILFLFFFLPGISRVLAQDEQSSIIEKLTDNSQKEWRLDTMTITLGNKCKNGEILFFSKHNTLIHRNCEKGFWVSSKKVWSISKYEDKWTIIIGQQKYFLVLGKEGRKDRLVLRTVAPGKKGATIDKIFLSEKS